MLSQTPTMQLLVPAASVESASSSAGNPAKAAATKGVSVGAAATPARDGNR